MKTFYIDVYFLINFTVDILALYFSALFVRIESTAKRLLISSVFASLTACAVVLLGLQGIPFLIILILSTIMNVEIFAPKETTLRKFKLAVAFLVFETFMGGFVNLVYNLLDTYIYPKISSKIFGAENKNILILSLIILLAYGLLKLIFIMFYTSKNEKNLELTIGLKNEEEKIIALVDSGCLVCDPLDSKPVIIAKRNALEMIEKIGNISEIEDIEIKKRIRVIPIKTMGHEKILIGIRCDYVKIKGEAKKYENIVIAFDEEEGSFGGYKALVPSALAE